MLCTRLHSTGNNEEKQHLRYLYVFISKLAAEKEQYIIELRCNKGLMAEHELGMLLFMVSVLTTRPPERK